MILQKRLDRGDQLWHIPEDAATNALVGDFAEPPLHHVHPRTRSRDEVQMEAWMSSEPGFHARVLVGRVVVHDDMQIEFGGGLQIDLAEEANELLMPMARHALANHLAIEHAESRKQGGRAVTLVVVRHRPTAALLQWKAWLGTIEGLDLTFLVDTQHKGFVRGIEIESDDIVELLNKMFVSTDLEGLDEMGFEVVLFPDTTDRRLAEALRLGHAPRTPVGRIRWLAMQRGLDDGTDVLLGNAWDTTRTWRVFLQARQPKSQKPFSPELHGGPGDVQFPCDVLAECAIGRHLDNGGTLHQSQGETAAMRPCGQSRTFFGRQQDRGCGSHASKI